MADMSTRTQQREAARARITTVVPILSWFPKYNRGWWSKDALAGLTLWGLLVPQGMAYAGIADLPAQAGMYTLVVSLLIYALMGTSRHLSVGPTSATSALLASSVAAAVVTATVVDGANDDQTYQAHAAAFVLVTGIVFLVAGMLKLGFITQFLSKPVMDGFVMGLAVFVAVGQLNKLFGVPKPEGNTVQQVLRDHQGAPRGELGCVRDRWCRTARPHRAAQGEPQDPGRPGRPVRRDPGQQLARPRGQS